MFRQVLMVAPLAFLFLIAGWQDPACAGERVGTEKGSGGKTQDRVLKELRKQAHLYANKLITERQYEHWLRLQLGNSSTSHPARRACIEALKGLGALSDEDRRVLDATLRTGRVEDTGGQEGGGLIREHVRAVSSPASISSRSGRPPSMARALHREARKNLSDWSKTGRRRHLKAALFHADSALVVEPRESEYWFTRGLILSRFEDRRDAQVQAASDLNRALSIDPSHERAQFLLAQLMVREERFLVAIAQFKFLIKNNPNMVTGAVLGPLAYCYAASKQAEEGEAYFEELGSKHPQSGHVIFCRAILLRHQGHGKQAGALLRDLVDWHYLDVDTGEKTPESEPLRKAAKALLEKWSVQEERP